MSGGCATEQHRLPTVSELLDEFRRFRAAASELEAAYRELRERADRVDQELAHANERLRSALEERDRILAAMPIGVLRDDGRRHEPLNAEAERLVERFEHTLPLADGGEIRVEDRDGDLRTLRHVHVDLAGDEHGLDFVEDHTDLVGLRERVARLDRLSGLSELALGVAHEIRNPLNGLAGFAALIRREPESSRNPERAARIEEAAMRMERTIRDLLAFARPEGRGAPCTRPLSAWLAQARTESGAGRLVVDPGAAAVVLEGSPQAFGTVLANLVRNAREAGASRIEVSLGRRAQGRVEVVVVDDGPGIAPEVSGRIFDPFVGTKETGSGLGLAFCARAMDAMGGSIRYEPTKAGACFVLDVVEGFS